VKVRRLHPDPAELEAAEAVGDLRLAERAPEGRPYVIANMVATADGRATIAGRSGPIGGAADRELFHLLRTQVDAVLVGPETLRVERYGRMIRDPELRARRAAAGLAPEPLAVTITRSGDVPADIPLLQEPEAEVVVYAGAPPTLEGVAARVHVHDLEPNTGPGAALARLRSEHGVRTVLCEGGPRLLGALVSDRALDELFLTVAPLLSGGEAERPIVAGPPLPEPARLELLWVLESEGELMLRYRVGS
jgi:riboflavin biosynthesis pyrimidine reductase